MKLPFLMASKLKSNKKNILANLLFNNQKFNISLYQVHRANERKIQFFLHNPNSTISNIKNYNKSFVGRIKFNTPNSRTPQHNSNISNNTSTEEKEIKHSLSTLRIKEISSYLFSRKNNQIKFINCIMQKSNDEKINKRNNRNFKHRLFVPIKLKSEKKKEEKDEDKTQIIEESLIPREKKQLKLTNISVCKSPKFFDNNLLNKALFPNQFSSYINNYQNRISKFQKIKKLIQNV